MANPSINELLVLLAGLLAGNHVDTETIVKALEQICSGMGWNCGLVYEATAAGQYCLTEHYAARPVALLRRDVFSAEDCAFLAGGGIHPVEKGPGNTPLELLLLELYNTESLILAPVLDENNGLFGLVVLSGKTDGAPMDAWDIGTMSVALAMLVRYVGVRVFLKRLSQSQITMGSILDNTGIDIYVNDFYTHEILYVNKSMAAPYGGAAQFMGRECWKTLFPGQGGPCEFCPQKELIDENGMPTKVYTWDYQRPFDGSWFRVFSSAFRWVDGRLAHVVSSADITDNKRNEALIERMANYDQLTNLPNRRVLLLECARRIEAATATEQGYLLFFDIDGFKEINDTYGHDAGDEFLVQLGEFFSAIPLLKGQIYRNGGDEFVAIMGGETITKDNVRNLAHFIHDRFRKPWRLKKGEVFCNASIGVACYPEDGTTVDTLLQKADTAMYRVKKSGGAGICFGYELAEDKGAAPVSGAR